MAGSSGPNLYHRPLPYGIDEDGNAAEKYVTTNQRDFRERDLSAAYVPKHNAADFQGRPLPYAEDKGADSLDRFITSSRAQFVPRDLAAARQQRIEASTFKGRPLPYALDDNVNVADMYLSAMKRQFVERDLAAARPVQAAHSNYHGRPLPYAVQEGSDAPDKWVSASKSHFVDLPAGEARMAPVTALQLDKDYNVVTLEPLPVYQAKDHNPRGRTAELGVQRPKGIDPVPASRKTEQHFIKYADTFHPDRLNGVTYGSHELMHHDVLTNAFRNRPDEKFRQPVTEAQRVGWTWREGHDGYGLVKLDAVPDLVHRRFPNATEPAEDPHFGRKASYFTKHEQSLKLVGKTGFGKTGIAPRQRM